MTNFRTFYLGIFVECALEAAVENYNNMPNARLFGCTPNEVLKGARPDKNLFKSHFTSGRKERILANRNFDCGAFCVT